MLKSGGIPITSDLHPYGVSNGIWLCICGIRVSDIYGTLSYIVNACGNREILF